MVLNGQPAEILTTISVVFALLDNPSGVAKLTTAREPSTPTAETIHLKNGRTIHADTVQEIGDRIGYSIGEGIYKINKDLVQDIVHAGPERHPAVPASPQPTASAKISPPPESSLPPNPIEGARNWYLYESTEELRDECRSGEFTNRIHPEFQSTSFAVKKDEAQIPCSIFGVDRGSDYEMLIDRGVELEKELCNAGGGKLPQTLPQPAGLVAKIAGARPHQGGF
jgi:hypothetical protein